MPEVLPNQLVEADPIQPVDPHAVIEGDQMPLFDAPETETTTANEQAVPVTEAASTPVAEASAEASPERALVRLGKRLLKTGDRRTTKQFAGDKASQARDFTSEKFDSSVAGTKKVASKVGNATLSAGVLTISTGLEKADKISTAASELKSKAASSVEAKKDGFVERMKARAAAASERKEARITARADRAEKRTFQTATKVYEAKRSKDYTKLFDEASANNKAMLKEAYGDNKQFDKDKKVEDRRAKMIAKSESDIAKHAESDRKRIERNQKIGKAVVSAAKTAGQVGLFTGAAIVGVPAVFAEKATKSAKKTIEVAGDVGKVVHVAVRNAQKATGERVNEAMITTKTKRADRLQDKTDALWDEIDAREAKSKTRRSL